MISALDWLSIVARVAARVRESVIPLIGTEGAGVELGTTGAGGDRTLAIDRLAEDIAISELQKVADSGERFSLLSEEAGPVSLGAEFPRVVIDPIDGSSNAKRGGLGAVAVMLSVLDGPTISDVVAGYTLDILTGDHWAACKDGSVTWNGRAMSPRPTRSVDCIEMLGLHALPSELPLAKPLLDASAEFRQPWCMSIALARTAAGSFDLFCAPRLARVLDMTAGLLMTERIGGVATDLEGKPVGQLVVSVYSRTALICSADPAIHRFALHLLSDAGIQNPRDSL